LFLIQFRSINKKLDAPSTALYQSPSPPLLAIQTLQGKALKQSAWLNSIKEKSRGLCLPALSGSSHQYGDIGTQTLSGG
jgi:hypothetical protein